MRWDLRRTILAAAATLAGALAACSGSSSSVGGDLTGDSSTPASDGATVDGSASDSAEDAGLIVTESPAPACHDLAQRAVAITPTATLTSAPTPLPITTIAPGLYVATAIVDYNGALPLRTAGIRTTVFFTPTKQYYVNDDTLGAHQQLTLEWSLSDGKFERKVLCSSMAGTAGATYRIGSSPNGFTVFIDNQQPGDRTETVRYERAP